MKRIIPVFLLISLAMACGKNQDVKPTPQDEANPTPTDETRIPINISFPITKVTDVAYESGDIVGLYVVNEGTALASSGNHANNVAYTFDGSAWSATTELYWKDQSTKASFYCYYPRLGSVTDVSAIPCAVNANQSTPAGYKSSELLWGSRENVAPTSDVVNITTTHRMSNLLVYIAPGNGYTTESIKQENIEILLNNLKVNATLNAATGEVTATGNPADITPYQDGDRFRALVPPQTLDNQTLVSLKVGDYSFSLKQTITLKSNTQHKVTITVNKVSEGINIGIGDWETDEVDYGGTVN